MNPKRTVITLWVLLALLGGSQSGLAAERIVYLAGSHGQAMIDFMEVVAEEFSQATGLEVEIQNVARSEALDRLLAMIVGGTAPDVAHLQNQDAFAFAERGLLENLAPYYERDKLDLGELSVPPVVEALEWGEGAIYLVPLAAQARGNFYNKGHFANAGIAEPAILKGQNDWNWESVAEVASKLTRRNPDGLFEQAGIYMSNSWTEWQTYTWQAGGDLFDRTIGPTRGTFRTDPARAALDWVMDLWNVRQVTPHVSDRALQRGNWFIHGTASMYLWGQPGHIAQIRDAEVGFDWDVAPHFSGPDSDVSYLALNTLQIPKDSRNKEAAWEFVKFVAFRLESARIFSEITGRTPALRAAFPEYVRVLGDHPANAQIFVDNLLKVRHGPVVSEHYGDLNGTIMPLYRSALNGERSPEAALEQMQSAVDAILQQ